MMARALFAVASCVFLLDGQVAAWRLNEKSSGRTIFLADTVFRPVPARDEPRNASFTLQGVAAARRDLNGVSDALDSRQLVCSDPAYPWQNGCQTQQVLCCPSFAESCCRNTGDCLDAQTNICCPGGQCGVTDFCCGAGCCPRNRDCCGTPGSEDGCCYEGDRCYQYLDGPYEGRYTCLSPAEASEIFDNIYTTGVTDEVPVSDDNNSAATSVPPPATTDDDDDDFTTTSRSSYVPTFTTSEDTGLGGSLPTDVDEDTLTVTRPSASATSSQGPVSGDEDCPGGFLGLPDGEFTCISEALGTEPRTSSAVDALPTDPIIGGGDGDGNAAPRLSIPCVPVLVWGASVGLVVAIAGLVAL